MLCSVKFAPLRNDKIYGAFSLAAELALHAGFAARLFCGQGSATGDKIQNEGAVKFQMRG
ncbi:hypothetical protein [uncultured Campylobacter sp.]|uniref:hypothetical protein n=1 Tax=uncultured Campylobacter sp. TaxID=218934 RepID=UPI00262F3311|nr:hypothetical protein [uncultured Campylobacter sp.]